MRAVSIRSICLPACLALALLYAGCSERSPQEPNISIQERLMTSLHGTANGIRYWYQSAQGGFESITGIPYDDLECKSCHVEPGECDACHTGGTPDGVRDIAAPAQSDDECYTCHSNQYVEDAIPGLTDVHRDELGYQCKDCHDADDVHGDGRSYLSMLEAGAITAGCENPGCHETIQTNEFHSAHAGETPEGAAMECSACHVRSVVTCYNCHFEHEVGGQGKLSYGQFTGWKLLLRRDRGDGNLKIDAGNMLTVTYQGKAFVAIAPYHAHTINTTAVTACGDCHGNQYVQEYESTGKIVLVSWDGGEGRFVQNLKGRGIIPIPPDWRTALDMDFATFVTSGGTPRWVRIEPTEVGMQMLFARPLEGMPQPK